MNLKTLASRMLVMLFLASTLLNFMPVVAQAVTIPTIYVDPPSIVDSYKTPGEHFTIDISIQDASDLFAYEVKIGYNNTILTPTSVEEGSFIKVHTTSPLGTYWTYIIDDEYVHATCVTLGKYPGVDGNGILLNITFTVEEVGESDLPLYDTILLDSNVTLITHDVVGGYFTNMPGQPIEIHTMKTWYSAGETMHLGLEINSPMPYPITVCVAVWLEKPTGPIKVTLHAHAVTLPGNFSYSDPYFMSFVLPPIPPGTYTWHAALLNPSPHAILIENTAEWEFI